MAFKTQFIYEAIDKLTPSLKKIGDTAIKMEKKVKDSAKRSTISFKKMGEQIGKTGKIMKSIGAGITKWITVPVAGAFTASILAGGKYQDALASLSAITGLQGKELKKLSKEIMSTSNTFGIASTEIASGMERIGSNQPELLSNPNLLLKVGKSAILMSKASGMAFDEAGDSLTGIMNQFSLTGEESDRVMNVLSAGAKFGSATIKQLSEAMIGIGPSAKDAGLSLEQTVATMEVLASKGLKGANAETKLRNIFTKMSVTMGKKFNPQVVGMAKALENVGKLSDKKLIKSFNEENLNTIKILTQNVGMFKALERNVTGSNAGFEQASIRMNTFNERVKKLWQRLKNTLIKVFLKMEPLLSKFVDLLIKGAEFLGDFAEKNKKTSIALVALAGALALAGPILLTIGSAFASISAILPTVLPLLAGIAGVSFAPLIGPALAVGSAVVALVAGITLLWRKSAGFRSFFKSMWSSFSEEIEPLMGIIRDLGSQFVKTFSSVSRLLFGANEGVEKFSVAGSTMGIILGKAFNLSLIPLKALLKTMEYGLMLIEKMSDAVEGTETKKEIARIQNIGAGGGAKSKHMAEALTREDMNKRRSEMAVNVKVDGNIKGPDGKPIQNQSIKVDPKPVGNSGAGQ
jgi:TP901 family phage tail tape measure protein